MKKEIITKPKGMQDILPSESYKWQYIEKTARETASLFGVQEIRTPILESSNLFERGVGKDTDIVSKEMYKFTDKSNRSLTLKPEGTAPIVRSYIENGLFNEAKPVKLFYISPFFRYERPQKGRFRQFNQFGVEYFGSDDIKSDVEIIELVTTFFNKLGLKDLSVKINYIGDSDDRNTYSSVLRNYFKDKLDNLCDNCKSRYNNNILRLIDCKVCSTNDIVKNAPSILDSLSNSSLEKFNLIKSMLDDINVKFVLDDKIVRGLDYYSGLVFEVEYEKIDGPSKTLCGGGRYDSLVSELGGIKTGAVGFGVGIERLLQEDLDIKIPDDKEVDIFVINNTDVKNADVKVANILRTKGFTCVIDLMQRSENANFKYASKLNVKNIIYIDEFNDNNIKLNLRNINNTNQVELEKEINIINEKKEA